MVNHCGDISIRGCFRRIVQQDKTAARGILRRRGEGTVGGVRRRLGNALIGDKGHHIGTSAIRRAEVGGALVPVLTLLLVVSVTYPDEVVGRPDWFAIGIIDIYEIEHAKVTRVGN